MGNVIFEIHEDRQGRIWFSTMTGAVFILENDTIFEVTTREGLTANMLEDMYPDRSGQLWAATLNGLNKITLTPLLIQPYVENAVLHGLVRKQTDGSTSTLAGTRESWWCGSAITVSAIPLLRPTASHRIIVPSACRSPRSGWNYWATTSIRCRSSTCRSRPTVSKERKYACASARMHPGKGKQDRDNRTPP